MELLADRVTVVTGGSSGIGRHISLAFADHGAAVFLASDLAAAVTGESLVVDGGWTSWR